MAQADERTEWRPPFPTGVGLTLGRLQQGPRDPVQRATPDGAVWRTARTAEGPATLRITARGGALVAEAWGPGSAAAVALAPRLLGERDDPSGFEPRHPLLADAHRRFPGLRIARTEDVLQALVAAVLEQRVQGGDAISSWRLLVERLGDPAPGPAPAGLRVFPDGTRWAAVPSWVWRRAGVDARRAGAVVAAAARDASLARLVARDPGEADRALRSLPGVGAWTSAEVRQRALGDADAVSVGDFHLAKIVGQALAGRPFDDAELLPFLEPWRPHRYRVARLLYALGIESLPRRGPRAPLERSRPGHA